MQNYNINPLSQNQIINHCRNTIFPSKNALSTPPQPTDARPNEFWTQGLSQLADLCP